MSVPRSYVSKMENGKACPTLSSLERLAAALDVTIPDLLSAGERTRQSEVRELLSDPFLASLVPFVGRLNAWQLDALAHRIQGNDRSEGASVPAGTHGRNVCPPFKRLREAELWRALRGALPQGFEPCRQS